MLQLYKNIKERRTALHLTQSELADKMGYADKSMIAKIEKGLVDLPQSKIIAFAKALETTPADLMGWEQNEDPRIIERDTILEDIEHILKSKAWSLFCESYDDNYFTIKNVHGQTITGLYDYELISRYRSLKKRGKITADLLVSSESVFKKYLESLGYYINQDDPEHKPFLHYGDGAVQISDNTLNDIRTKIDTYTKATVDSVILKLNEKELRKEREEKERFAAYLLNAAHAQNPTEEQKQHADSIMTDDSEWT